MPSPKFTVPHVSVAISGFSDTGAALSSTVMPTAPPVDICTIRSVLARTSSMICEYTAGSWVGLPSGFRACMWAMDAPSFHAR